MATQAGRPMVLSTPLGDDKLLIQAFHGEEFVSGLFNFTIDCIGKPNEVFEFDKLLGQGVGVKLFAADSSSVIRHFHGHVRCITQGESNKNSTNYSLEIVPHFWMLTKKSQSRIFQQVTVTQILKDVLKGFNFKIDADDSKLKPRDYCVQYRETDWNFASRLMEEEGFYYYFEFGDMSHELIITSAGKAPVVPHNPSITYKNVQHAAAQKQEFIYQFTKSQEMIAGKVVLWDHCFEDPLKHFLSESKAPATVTQGEVTHKLTLTDNDKLELYDYPGEYAQRFDGVDPGSADRKADVDNIPPDGARTAKIRAEDEAATAVWGQGSSTCGQLTPGHKFTMATQSTDVLTVPMKADGDYMVLSVNHSSRVQDAFRSGGSGEGFLYQNSFEVISNTAIYHPPRYTPKPIVPGSQTATVVGPSDHEIFTDKYGRVKVQFPWDREGKMDGASSCWLRVGTAWAGQNWGMFHLPRIGQEVLVDFLEGDPDQPIIVGSVYNADNMPPYKLPDEKTKSTLKSRSTLKGTPDNFNEIRFEDLKDKEEIYIHAEKDMNRVVENNDSLHVFNNQKITIGHNRTVNVGPGRKSPDPHADGKHTETVFGDYSLKISKGDYKLEVEEGHADVAVLKGNHSHSVGTGTSSIKVKKQFSLESTDADIAMKAKTQIKLECGASSILLKEDGTIEIKGVDIKINGSGSVAIDSAKIDSIASGIHTIKGATVKINS